jgi:F0F1-type ATP synthase delta subunit
MKKAYIKAVTALILQGEDITVVLKNLESTLVRKGHQGLKLGIFEGVLKELEQNTVSDTATVYLGNVSDENKLKANIETSLKAIGGELKSAKIVIDKTLTGGYVATYKGKTIDASYKTKLLKLYRTITT